jgi:hypothetical protein
MHVTGLELKLDYLDPDIYVMENFTWNGISARVHVQWERGVLFIHHYHEQTVRVKLSLALAGCNGKDTSKPRLVIDAGIMKEIGDDLEGRFRLGQVHSILLLLHFRRCMRWDGREGIRL